MRLPSTAASTRQGRAAKALRQESTVKTEADIMTRTKTARRSPNVTDTYFSLVKRHPLTSIRNEKELDAAQAVVDALLRENLDDGELAYLDALSDLVIVYEQEHHAVTPLPPHELLAYMLDERNMSQADLARTTGLAKATVSDLTTGKRSFTVNQMHKVAQVFGLPGTVFMPKSKSKP
jgi:HTH-type transcriptional regulator / antitoxin HigA